MPFEKKQKKKQKIITLISSVLSSISIGVKFSKRKSLQRSIVKIYFSDKLKKNQNKICFNISKHQFFYKISSIKIIFEN